MKLVQKLKVEPYLEEDKKETLVKGVPKLIPSIQKPHTLTLKALPSHFRCAFIRL